MPTPSHHTSKDNAGRTINLHPLVIMNISDHYTRALVNKALEREKRIFGLLYGVQNGLVVDIFNSFELQYSKILSTEGEPLPVASEYVDGITEQFNAVFPKYELLGWYSIGEAAKPLDLSVHREMLKFNESPLFLLLNPTVDANSTDLPISMYESEIHVQNDVPKMILVRTPFKIETQEMERIAIDQMAKAAPADGSSSLSVHLDYVRNSIVKVNDRILVLLEYLRKTQSGEVPKDHRLLRQVSRICHQLPLVENSDFRGELGRDYNDALLLTYLSSLTKGTASIDEMLDKFILVHDARKGRFSSAT